jgi:hypothetical protein
VKNITAVLICVIVLLTSGASHADTRAPFFAGESWWVSQGNNQGGHTTNLLRYGWDFNWGSGNQDLGKPVVASRNGRVVVAYGIGGYNNGWGNTVVTHSDEGGYERVAHLDVVFVKVGENVRQGQVLGLMGTTGQSTGVHLHYQHQNSESGNSSSISFNDIGIPQGCNCNSNLGWNEYTSQNSNIINREFSSNGGSTYFGYPINNIHWSENGWNPNDLYNQYGGSKRCYMRDYTGGRWPIAAIVYDALGGARRSYTVRCGFYDVWTAAGGPRSSLRMPLTNEYENYAYASRQDFVFGYLRYIQGASPEIRVMTYPVCAPGWVGSWDRSFSYLFDMVYDRNGRYQVIGNATENVVSSWRGTQYFTQRFSGGSRGSGMIVYDPNNIVDNPQATNEAYYIYSRFYQYWTTVDAVGPWVLGAPTRDRVGNTQYFKYGRMVEQTLSNGNRRVRVYDQDGTIIWTSPQYAPKLIPENEIGVQLPDDFVLHQNYPNPFNSQTVISYSLPQSSDVTLSIYNLLGQNIGTLVNEQQPAGQHTITWVADQQPSGIYFYRLETGSASETKKMVLIK